MKECCKTWILRSVAWKDRIKFCPICGRPFIAIKLEEALRNLLRSADTYGTHNMGPAKDQAKEVLKEFGEKSGD